MTPPQLIASYFVGYSPDARAFAEQHLPLLKQLPLAVCPSFLQQIQRLDSLFPAEREQFASQCAALGALPATQLASLTAPLNAVSLPESLRSMDWVRFPSQFVTELTAHLWSSSQINLFREATDRLFAATPAHQDPSPRLAVVILGQAAQIDRTKTLRKLRRYGVTFTALQHQTAFADIATLLTDCKSSNHPAYTAWYVDGGALHPQLTTAFDPSGNTISYAQLEPIRQRVLARAQATISSGSGGAEQLRTRLMETTLHEAGASQITPDPVLQRFYTELFTESSGPQIFTTSFVQWTGRELARRARPQELLLRYAPRQHRRDMNAMFAEDAPGLDPQGSLLDAEMGAYYTWLEMRRITAPGKLTFIAWVEDQSLAVVITSNAPAGVVSETSLSLAQVIASFA